jgi:subtilisin family serine protease
MVCGFDIREGFLADGHLAYIQRNDGDARCAGLKTLLSNHSQTVLIAADDDDIGGLLGEGQSQRSAKTIGSSADDGCSVFPTLA